METSKKEQKVPWSGIGTDVNFRKAVQAAINKDDINKAVNNGAATILKVDICPMYGGYPDQITGVPFDVAAAKAYLAKSSYKGEPYAITCQAGTTYETVAKVMRSRMSISRCLKARRWAWWGSQAVASPRSEGPYCAWRKRRAGRCCSKARTS